MRLLVAVLLIATASAAQPDLGGSDAEGSTPTTMYFHINTSEDFPINTQLPEERYIDPLMIARNSMCIDDPTGTQATGQQHHTWRGHLSPSIVEYDRDENGGPRIHNEPGMSYAALLDTNVAPTVTWYLESDLHATAGAQPVPAPRVVVRATARESNDVSLGPEGYDAERLLAHGESAPAILAGANTIGEHVTVHEVGDRILYGFTFPLALDNDTVPVTGFNVRIDAFIENPLCDDEALMPETVWSATAPGLHPHLSWSILNPLRIGQVHPMFVGDAIVVHADINSPWGNYDVRRDLPGGAPLQFDITGPGPALNVETSFVEPRMGSWNDHHGAPLAVAWIWHDPGHEAVAGRYTVAVTGYNAQGNAKAVGSSDFELCNGGRQCVDALIVPECQCAAPLDQQTPGLAPAMILAMVGMLAARRR